nr:HEAT repeat domain-containing protein [Streptomyces sp. NBC_00995]
MAPDSDPHPGTAVLAEMYAAIGEPGYATVAKHSAFTREKSVTKSTVYNVLNGRTKPQPSTVDAVIAACLDYAGKHPRTAGIDPPSFRHWRDRYRSAVLTSGASGRTAVDPVLAGYLEQARAQFRLVQLETLTPLSDQDEHPAMGLGEVFLAQSVRENPPPVDLPREVWRRLVERGHLRDDDLPTGMDRAGLDRLRQAYQQRKPKPVLTMLAQPSATRVVLLGDPGSGKSTLARYLALTLAGGARLPAGLAPLAGVTPIVIELRVYISDAWGSGDFLDLLDFQYSQEGFGLPRKAAQSLLTSGPSLIVFDGLDEVFDPAEREGISRRIAGFATRYPLARVVVTSRVVGYHRPILDTAGFAHYKLEDFDREQIGAFVHQWYTTAYLGNERECKRLHDRLLTAIDNARPVAELAGNPMLLTILAIISRRRELPRDRREVYDHAVTVLVEHWDISKHLAARHVDQGMPYIDRRAKVELLHRVARRMQDAPAGLAGNHIPGQDLTEEFEGYLRDTYELPKDRAKTVANAMLDQFQQRNFILSRFGTGVYGFVHRAFLEYLAADDIVQRFGRRRKLSEQDIIDIFTRRWSDPSWHEVLRHIAGMLEEEFIASVIDHLLDLSPTWRQSVKAMPNHLVLAVQCLSEVRRLGVLTDQSKRVATAITDMLGVAEIRHRRHDTALVELIEQKVLPVLSAFSQHWAGAEVYRRWFDAEEGNLARQSSRYRSEALNLATRMRVVLRGSDPEFHERLLAQLAGSVPALRMSAICGLTTLGMENPTTVDALHRVAEADAHADVRLAAIEAIGQNSADARVRTLLMRRAETDAQSSVRAISIQLLTADRPHRPEMADWLRRLAVGTPDDDVRRAAIAAMDVENADPGLLEWLQGRVDADIAPQVREAAVSAAASGWAGDPAVRRWLSTLAEQAPAADVRGAALRAVAEHWRREPGVLDWIRDRARLDTDSGIRRAVVEVLAESWLNDPEVVEWLRACITGTHDMGMASSALRAVGTVSRDHDSREWLRGLAAHGWHWYLRNDAIRLVAERWGSEPGVQAWLRDVALSDQDELVRNAAVEATLSHAAAGDTLAWLTSIAESDPNEYVRANAIEAIMVGWLDQPHIVSWLRTRLAVDPGGQVGAAVVSALASVRIFSADSSPTEIVAGLRDIAESGSHLRVRYSVTQMIADWFADEPAVKAWLHEIARTDGRPEMRSLAVRALVGISDATPENYAWLREVATTDMHWDVRHAGMDQLSSRWRHETELLFWLKETLAREHEPELRERIVNAVAERWTSTNWLCDPEVIDWLVEVAEADRDGVVRAAATAAVVQSRVQWPETLGWLTERLTGDPDSKARTAMVQALAGRWPGHDTKALLEDIATTDRSGHVRAAAIAQLADGWGQTAGMLDWLTRIATTDPHRAAREEAVTKIVLGRRQGPETLDWIKAVATADAAGSVRAVAIELIVEHWPNHPEACEWLRGQVAHNSEPLARASAIRQLGQRWGDRAGTLPWLRDVGEADPDALARIAAIEIAGECGALDPATSPWLRERVTADKDPTVQACAVTAAAHAGRLLPDTPDWLRDIANSQAHWHCRSNAIELLAAGWLRDDEGMNWLRRIAADDQDAMVRATAIETAALSEHRPGPDWLKNMAADDDPGVVRAVVRTLAATRPFDEDTVPWLRGVATGHDEETRRTVLRELSHLGAAPVPDTQG